MKYSEEGERRGELRGQVESAIPYSRCLLVLQKRHILSTRFVNVLRMYALRRAVPSPPLVTERDTLPRWESPFHAKKSSVSEQRGTETLEQGRVLPCKYEDCYIASVIPLASNMQATDRAGCDA